MIRQLSDRMRSAASLAGLAFLTACGGGGVAVKSVPYEGEVTSASYIGKTFPVFFLVGETGDPQGRAVAGKGTITYNTNDTVTLRLPGNAPVVLARTGASGLGTNYQSAGSDPLVAVVTGFSSTPAFRLATSLGNDMSFLGGFGFETQVADRPASATYQTAGAVFLTATNVKDFLPIAGNGTLNANFGAGTISGTLLSADPVDVKLAGDPNTADELALRFLLANGQITPQGFSGGVTATGELIVDGAGAPRTLTSTVSGGSASGAFFGGNAEAVTGTFSGDLALSDGGTKLVDFDAAGFFSGSAN